MHVFYDWEKEYDWCGDGRIVESCWARQDGSICNTNWRIIGKDKREGYRGIKWYKWHSDKILEGWGDRMWVILDSSVNGMPNQQSKQLLEEISCGSGMEWYGLIVELLTCKSKGVLCLI